MVSWRTMRMVAFIILLLLGVLVVAFSQNFNLQRLDFDFLNRDEVDEESETAPLSSPQARLIPAPSTSPLPAFPVVVITQPTESIFAPEASDQDQERGTNSASSLLGFQAQAGGPMTGQD